MNLARSLLALLSFAGAVALAQTDRAVSPEVLPDRRVTFRLVAANAQSAGVFIDSMKTGSLAPMQRDAQGIWTATLGPLDSGIYVYHFNVDGLNIADPINPKVKLRARTSASLLEVPASNPVYWQARDIPHGTVHLNFHTAVALGGETRELWVYTPPNYDRKRSKRYPVLYLLHGNNDTPAGWTTVARANFTMDSLLAEARVREMIIVTPFGHAVPFGAPREQNQQNTALFEKYLLNDVLPFIETKYRVAKGRRNRAIAGFSMGGGHALHIGLSHLDLFSSVAGLSPAVPQDFETRFASLLSDPQESNKKLDVFWIGCGKEDFLFDASKKLSELLTLRGIDHTYRATEGGHTFNVWRGYFAEIAPLLFR